MGTKIDTWDAIKQAYDNGDSDSTLATKFNINQSTIRSYRNRHNWGAANATDDGGNVAKNEIDNDVLREVKNEKAIQLELKLNDRQSAFCREYLASANVTQAYLNVYNCSRTTAASNGYKLLRHASITQFLDFLRAKQTRKVWANRNDVILRLMKIANANPADVIDWHTFKIKQYRDDGSLLLDVDGKQVYQYRTEAWIKDDADLSNVHTIRTGKTTLNATFESRLKALDMLLKVLPAGDNDRRRVRFNKQIDNIETSLDGLRDNVDPSILSSIITDVDKLRNVGEGCI